MTVLLYTFKSFPYIEKFNNFELFKFHKLKIDCETFKKTINISQPSIIIGIARSPNKYSRFETKAVNIFNASKKISRRGVDNYKLCYPLNGYKHILINSSHTDSFCNWTMYKIAEYIDTKKIKLQFIHITKKDIGDLVNYLNFLAEDTVN